jgi:uncharacterized protein (TIGR03435 family)
MNRLPRFRIAVVMSVAAFTAFGCVCEAQSAPQAQTKLPPMPADAKPGFDVVTIKPSDPNVSRGTYFQTSGRHILAVNVSANDLISLAYGMHTKQIVDGPAWLSADRFDIDGVPDVEGHPNHEQLRVMMQQLLASRFKLAFHRDKRILAVYAITAAKDGPKLTKTERKPGDSTGFSYTGAVVLTVRNATMADFADGMQASFMDKPVVDQTGLKDRYDFVLKWTPDDATQAADALPGLYTAIEEQLGLKLVPAKAAVDVLVIDRMDRPAEN